MSLDRTNVPATQARLDQMRAEEQARSFIEFIHDVDNLNAVIVILVFCEKPKTTTEVVAHLRKLRASEARAYNALDFICRQGLERGSNDQVHAIPKAIDELIYRVGHDGNASPPISEETLEKAKIIKALIRVEEALEANGYRSTGKRRVRVVK